MIQHDKGSAPVRGARRTVPRARTRRSASGVPAFAQLRLENSERRLAVRAAERSVAASACALLPRGVGADATVEGAAGAHAMSESSESSGTNENASPPFIEPTSGGSGQCGAAGVSRRGFIQTLGLSSAAAAIGTRADAALAAKSPSQADAEATVLGPDAVAMPLTVNGSRTTVTAEVGATLLEVLRGPLALTGSKEVCDRGSCGGCSVLVDGALVTSCMMLAVDAIGCEVTTIEGLAQGDRLDPIQESFIRHDALQCGFCTPGLVMACKALLNHHPKPSMDQIRKGLSGNICRCGTYTNIFNAVLEASGQPVPTDAALPVLPASEPTSRQGGT